MRLCILVNFNDKIRIKLVKITDLLKGVNDKQVNQYTNSSDETDGANQKTHPAEFHMLKGQCH